MASLSPKDVPKTRSQLSTGLKRRMPKLLGLRADGIVQDAPHERQARVTDCVPSVLLGFLGRLLGRFLWGRSQCQREWNIKKPPWRSWEKGSKCDFLLIIFRSQGSCRKTIAVIFDDNILVRPHSSESTYHSLHSWNIFANDRAKNHVTKMCNWYISARIVKVIHNNQCMREKEESNRNINRERRDGQ